MNIEKKNLYVLIRGGNRRPAYIERFLELEGSTYRFMQDAEIDFNNGWWKLGRCFCHFGYPRLWLKETGPGDLIGIFDLTDRHHVKTMVRMVVDVCKISFEDEQQLEILQQSKMAWWGRLVRCLVRKEVVSTI